MAKAIAAYLGVGAGGMGSDDGEKEKVMEDPRKKWSSLIERVRKYLTPNSPEYNKCIVDMDDYITRLVVAGDAMDEAIQTLLGAMPPRQQERWPRVTSNAKETRTAWQDTKG